MRLHRGAAGQEDWHLGLGLVAHHLVSQLAGQPIQPLYNHVESAEPPRGVADAHREIAARLRRELSP